MTTAERISRHEGYFTKISEDIDELKDEVRNHYVRAPTFFITLISVVALLFGSVGSALTIVYNKTESNQQSIVEIAVEQGKSQERQESIEKNINLKSKIIQLADSCKECDG